MTREYPAKKIRKPLTEKKFKKKIFELMKLMLEKEKILVDERNDNEFMESRRRCVDAISYVAIGLLENAKTTVRFVTDPNYEQIKRKIKKLIVRCEEQNGSDCSAENP